MECPIGKECEWLEAERRPLLTVFKEQEPQSHSHEELNFANKKNEFGSCLFSGASRQARLVPGFSIVVPQAKNPVTPAELWDNNGYFKLLSLWQCVTQK